MLLRELFEAPSKKAVLAFGRLNPPTIGHAKLVDAITSQEGDHYLFLSHTQKPKTDPLDFATKMKFAKQFFPGINIGHQSANTPVAALEMLQSLGYTDIIFVAGSDRVDGFQKLFDTYNGQPDKSGKVPFKFNSIKVVSAGERDPDADDVSGMSASKMRALAAQGELESFAQGVPDKKLAKTMYDAVRKGMGVKDTQPAEGLDDEDERDEIRIANNLKWPEIVNKVNSAMKAMGWKGKRMSDDSFLYSTKGQETDDQWYMVTIDNAGNNMFTYALGTVEDGEPHIDDSFKETLPNTEASVSELMNAIRDGFGLNEGVAEGVDIGQEWMSDTELDQYVPERLQQQWRELLGYDRNGNPSALWANLTGGYEPDVRDPQHRSLMVKVANKWFAAKKIPNVKFFDVRDADDELDWLVQIGPQGVAEGDVDEGWKEKFAAAEAAPGALRAAGGIATAALSGVGGALIGQMFAPFLGATAGGIAGAIGGYKAGAGATDALWDKVAELFGSKENAKQAAMVHAQAAAAGEKSFEFGGKKYPVTLKPQDAQKLNVSAEDVSPKDEKKFHNELDDLVHKYFGDSPDEEKMKKKMKKAY